MKSLIAFHIILFLFVLGVHSSFAGDEFNGGFRGGLQYSNLSREGSTLWRQPYFGYYIGIFGTVKINKTGLLKLNSGITYYQVGANDYSSYSLGIHYLNLPVGLQIKIGPLFALGGLNGALKLGATSTSSINEKYISNFDWGIFIGLGAKFSKIGVEAKYDWGQADVYRKYSSRYLQVGLVYYFNK